MKRILIAALLVTSLVGIAAADWVTVYTKPFGNLTGARMSGTQGDTVVIPLSVIANAKWLAFQVRADSVVDSLPDLQAVLGFYNPITAAWVNTSFATADGGDTLVPLDGYVTDTLLTQTALLPHYSTLWSVAGSSARLVFTGKRAFQAAKACTVRVYVRK